MAVERVADSALPRVRASLGTDSTLVFLGFALQLLQVGIIPLLPLIAGSLHLSPVSTSWLVTSSLLAGLVFLAVFSRLADLIGKVPVIQLSLALVFAGSLIGCFAQGFVPLLVGRILMGAVMPLLALPEALAADTMPRVRAGVVIAAIHGGTGTGVAGGFVLGALAGAGNASWRWFFIVGAVASMVGILASRRWLKDGDEKAEGKLEGLGAALLAIGLSTVLLAVSEGPNWGWGTIQVWGLGLFGIAVLVLWVAQQSRARYALVDTRLLFSERVRIPLAMSLLGSLGIYSSFTALSRFALSDPHALGYGYGWEPLQIAWFAVPQTIGCVASFFVVRNLVGRNRPIQALALGFVIVALAFTFYAILTVDPALALAGLLLNSLGISIILALTQIVLVRSVPSSQSGIVLGFSIMLYTLGNAIGAAVAAVCFQSFGSTPEAPSLEAFRVLFVFGGVAALVGLSLCLPLARSRRADPVPAPVAETSPG